MSMAISHPWLAPRSLRIGRNGGGNTDAGGVFPLLLRTARSRRAG